MKGQLSNRVLPPVTTPGPLLPWLLTALAPTNRTRVKQLLTHGRVQVNSVAVTRHDYPLQPGDRVGIGEVQIANALPILFEDDAVVIVDKPTGLLTVATESEKTDTAFRRLAALQCSRPGVVHRLDRDTSGVLLFAKSPRIRDRLQAEWDRVTKTYFAIVEGTPRTVEGIIDNHLLETSSLKVRTASPREAGAKHAVTSYQILKRSGAFSLLEVVIETGRKHQIRVHLAGLGTPIIGDAFYGATSNPARRLGLHAHRLAFPHPLTGTPIAVESPLPPALARIV